MDSTGTCDSIGHINMIRFLTKHQVSKGCAFTHTSLGKPLGSFYIPTESSNELYRHYAEALEAGDDLYITEKHRHISPILIDLDFRFDLPEGEEVKRKYTEEHVHTIVEEYTNAIHEVFDIQEYDVYVLEKPSPSVLNNKQDNQSSIKDGLHIIVPGIVSRPSIQYLLRNRMLVKLEEVFKNMGCVNPVSDIIDEAVIERNNWLMYGSKKPGGVPYEITYIYKVTNNELEYTCKADNNLHLSDDKLTLVRTLSIRNKYDETKVKSEAQQYVRHLEEELDQRRKKMETARNIIQEKSNTNKNQYHNIEQVINLVNILSPARADNYNDWIRLGWCLRNIDHRLLTAWETFSKKSRKYTDGQCETLWNKMRPGGLGIGSLHMWAKQDNLDAYTTIVHNDLKDLIFQARSGTHNDIAHVIWHMYQYEYVCTSIKLKQWYEFKNHRWHPCDGGYSLRMKISDEVWKEFLTASRDWTQKALEAAPPEQPTCQEHSKKFAELALKLKCTTFKDSLMKECAELFYNEKFEEMLDSNLNLIGFDNGVYDLDTFEFREGRPEDYISYSTRLNYVPHDPNHVMVEEVRKYFAQVITIPHVREYVLKLMATFLHGAIKDQKFYIWTGSGCHAIDAPIMMSNGSIKCVQDVVIGDQLMGDDGTPRNVLKLCRGHGDMYRVTPSNGKPYIVNGDHIMSLVVTKMYSIKNEDGKVVLKSVRSIDRDMNKRMIKTNSFDSATAATAYINTIESENMGDIVDISVREYIDTFENNGFGKRNVYLYRPESTKNFNKVETMSFTIERVEDDYFYGFELDGNHRYLDGDLIVQHNSNSKSLCVEFFEKCFGDYCCKFPITLLTQKRAASNAATSELARAKGKRFACLQEPSEDEKLNIGLMKELSGGDKILARAIYKEPVEFKPQFKMLLLCNHLPSVPSDDGGTWRRIRVVEFTSKFVDNPVEENEFPIDLDLPAKMEEWREHFIPMLIEYFKLYKQEGLHEPEEVLACTRDYKRQNDHLADFIHHCIEKKDSAFLSLNDAFMELKAWVKDDNINLKMPTKSELDKYLSKNLIKCVSNNNFKGYKGYRLKNRYQIVDNAEGEDPLDD